MNSLPKDDPPSETQLLAETAERCLYPNYARPGVVLVRGEGAKLWDQNGKRYIDFYAGVAVSALGHGHPELVKAIQDQAAKLIHTSNYYHNEPNVLLAEDLTRRTGFSRAFFCNSGTEANEAMLKLARRHFFERGESERVEIIAFENAFHGRTLGSLAATGTAKYRQGFGPLGPVSHVPYGDLSAVEARLSSRTAGIIVEPVLGEAGAIEAPPGFLRSLRELATRAGALLLVDEIQTGVGRTGTFLAIEAEDARPDALTLAKGLGGGVPIGALLTGEHLAASLPKGSHGSTFGGNPLASAAALAVLRTLDKESLLVRVQTLGAWLADRLDTLRSRSPLITRRTGRGLLQAIELVPEQSASALLGQLRDRGLLVTLAGSNALRFTPPLTISDEEFEEGLTLLEETLMS